MIPRWNRRAELLPAGPRDIDEHLGAAQIREQTQQQHRAERFNDLIWLQRVRQISE